MIDLTQKLRLQRLRQQYESAYENGEPVLGAWLAKNQIELVDLEKVEADSPDETPEQKFIIAYTVGTEMADHWQVVDTEEEARKVYNEILLLDHLYTASVFTQCIMSTDYEV